MSEDDPEAGPELDQESLSELQRVWQEKLGDTVLIPRARYEALMGAAEAWRLVENLRAPEGHSITLLCDNPDFNGQPNCAIEVCAEWTNWEPKRFTGDTILATLQSADITALRSAGLQSDA